MQCLHAMRFTFIIGLVPAASVRGPVKRRPDRAAAAGRPARASDTASGSCPFKRDVRARPPRAARHLPDRSALRVHVQLGTLAAPRRSRSTSKTRACLGPSRLLLVRTRNGRPASPARASASASTSAPGATCALQVGRRRQRLSEAGRVRPLRSVAARSRAASASVSCPSPSCQRQLPSAMPGRFMRASLPRPSTSCAGTIASAARDESASSISDQCGSAGSRPVAARALASSESHQPTAVSVSCVPV